MQSLKQFFSSVCLQFRNPFFRLSANSQGLILWIIIMSLACIVYLTGIAHESIWFDEAFSYQVASHSPGEILGLMARDNHPPLYYLLNVGVSKQGMI